MTTIVYHKGSLWCDSLAVSQETGERHLVQKWMDVSDKDININGEKVIYITAAGIDTGFHWVKEEIEKGASGEFLSLAHRYDDWFTGMRNRLEGFSTDLVDPQTVFLVVTEKGAHIVRWAKDQYGFFGGYESRFFRKESPVPCGIGCGFHHFMRYFDKEVRSPYTCVTEKGWNLRARFIIWIMKHFVQLFDKRSSKLSRVC